MHFKFHLDSYHHSFLDIKILVASYACDSLGVWKQDFPLTPLHKQSTFKKKSSK